MTRSLMSDLPKHSHPNNWVTQCPQCAINLQPRPQSLTESHGGWALVGLAIHQVYRTSLRVETATAKNGVNEVRRATYR